MLARLWVALLVVLSARSSLELHGGISLSPSAVVSSARAQRAACRCTEQRRAYTAGGARVRAWRRPRADRLCGRRASGGTPRGKTTHWIWDGNVPLHEWITLSNEALARDGAPLATSAELAIALAKREALLARRSAQGPPGGAATAIPTLEGTADSPITWLFEPESFSPLAKLVADERYSIVTDHLGTPRAMFDERGRQSWAAEIDTYGRLSDVKGLRAACPFRFPGQYEDAETGLYYNRFRYYDAQSGGYVSQDPIGLAGGRHAYAYTRQPTTRIDPLGLSGCQTDEARHINDFQEGAAVFLPKDTYNWAKENFANLGRPDGLFVMRKSEADALQSTEKSTIRNRLGIPDGQEGWDGPLVRLDIVDPLARNPRMATGTEQAANKLWKPGGYTSGGVQEIIIDPVPWNQLVTSLPF